MASFSPIAGKTGCVYTYVGFIFVFCRRTWGLLILHIGAKKPWWRSRSGFLAFLSSPSTQTFLLLLLSFSVLSRFPISFFPFLSLLFLPHSWHLLLPRLHQKPANKSLSSPFWLFNLPRTSEAWRTGGKGRGGGMMVKSVGEKNIRLFWSRNHSGFAT